LASKLSTDVKNALKNFVGEAKKVSTVFKKTTESDITDVSVMLEKVESLRLSPKIAQWSEYYSGKNELPSYDGT
jgi:hypothetical protein